MLDQMPTVDEDGAATLVDPEGKLTAVGGRDAVGGRTDSLHSEEAGFEADIGDRALASRQKVRAQERFESESGMDAQATAERFVRTRAPIVIATPAPSIATLATARRTAVRKQRSVNGNQSGAGASGHKQHPSLWRTSDVPTVTGDATPRVPQPEMYTGPLHGSAVID